MSSRKKQRLTVRTEEDFAIVSLDDMEIWDGADLALIREALTKRLDPRATPTAVITLD